MRDRQLLLGTIVCFAIALALILFLVYERSGNAAEQPIALIDTGEHGRYLSNVLSEESIEFVYYDLATYSGRNDYERMELALGEISLVEVKSIALPYILPTCHDDLLTKLNIIRNIYISAAYIDGPVTADCYRSYTTIVGTLDDQGRPLKRVNYQDIELIADGCYGIHCSNSLAAVRAASQMR